MREAEADVLTEVDHSGPVISVLQVAREMQPGKGVAGVAWNLDRGLADSGYLVDRMTAESLKTTGAGLRRLLPARLAHLVEVVSFSLVSPIGVRRWRTRQSRSGRLPVVITHNDCISGDVYVNHGVHKSVVVAPNGRPRWRRVLRNPLHLFLLGREWWRFRSGANRVIVNFSELGVRELARYHRVSTDVTHRVIPNGVDLARYTPDPERGARVRAELGFDDADLIGLFVGHEFERKGLPTVISALPGVAEVKLIVVGGTASTIGRAQASCRRRTLDGRVAFVGPVDDVAGYYNAADFLVLPSEAEAWPLVLLEAMACGLPCLATRVSSIPALVEHGTNGFLVDRSSESLRRHMRILVERPDELRRMSRNASETARRYSWDVVVGRYVELIRKVALRSGGGDVNEGGG